MEISESKIIKECQKGNLENFTQIYDKYIHKIYDFIYYKVSNKEEAEDLTSQTFLKALDKIKTFDFDKGSFSSWLYRIARNTVIDNYRTQKPQTNIEDHYNIKNKENIEEKLSTKQDLSKVNKYLDNLTEEQKEIVVMRLWDQLSYREISEITNKSESSCKMMFSRTISKLRQEIILILIIINLIIKHLLYG